MQYNGLGTGRTAGYGPRSQSSSIITSMLARTRASSRSAAAGASAHSIALAMRANRGMM